MYLRGFRSFQPRDTCAPSGPRGGINLPLDVAARALRTKKNEATRER